MFKYKLIIEIMQILSDCDLEDIKEKIIDEYYPQSVEIAEYIIKNKQNITTEELSIYIKDVFDKYFEKDHGMSICNAVAKLIQLKIKYM